MNWQKDKLTIIGFGIIFVILGVFGYILWDMNREPLAEVVMEPTPITTKIEPKVEVVTESTPIAPKIESKVVEKEEKSKVRIYTEESELDAAGEIWDIKIFRTINNNTPELLTTLRDVYNFGLGLSYNVELSPDKNNVLIQYTTSGNSSKLQVLNLETKEMKDIIGVEKDLNILSAIFSPDSKQVFFLQSTPKYTTDESPTRLTVTYDFNVFTIADKKSEMVSTVKTRSEIFDPRWLPDNKILLTYALETTRENPESRYELYTLNLENKTLSPFINKAVLDSVVYRNNLFNQDNSLFAKPKTFTTKEFAGCYAGMTTAPNSFAIVETISGKEIASFKGNPEEPIDPITFSPDNKEILYILNGDMCRSANPEKYYVQSLYENKPREEVNLDDIIKKWDIIFNVYPFGKAEIIFYQ